LKANYLEKILSYDFGNPPHTLIFPGKLHFMEAEALIILGGAPKEVMEMAS
jgi:diphthine synthase